MSSVVKKAARFMPKVKRQPVRPSTADKESAAVPTTPAGPGAPAAPPTPPATQATQAVAPAVAAEALSAPPPAAAPKIGFSFAAAATTAANEDIDPMDTSRTISTATPAAAAPRDSGSSDGSDDDDHVFALQLDASRRRQLSVHMRRLSGIAPGRLRSVSKWPAEGEEEPVVIGIPTAKPSRRRKLVVRRGRQGLFLVKRREAAPVQEEHKRKYSVGIDPRTQKLAKYAVEVAGPEAVISAPEAAKSPEKGISLEAAEVAGEAAETVAATLGAVVATEEAELRTESPETPETPATPAAPAATTAPSATARSIAPRATRSSARLSSLSADPAGPTTYKTRRRPPRAPKLELTPHGKLNSSIDSITRVPRSFRNEDPIELEDITIEPDKMKMLDLCLPTFAVGRPSTRYQQVIDAKRNQAALKEERRRLREQAKSARMSIEEITGQTDRERLEKKRDILSELPDGAAAPLGHALQLKVVGGQMVVDPDLTSVARGAHDINADKDREVANPFDNPITSATYSKRRYTDQWDGAEMDRFYRALLTWGTDFTFIAQLFPHRTRKQIKLKFNLEERKHPEVVDLALRAKLPADFESYCRELRKDILTLDEYNDQLKELKEKHEEEMRHIAAQRDKAIKEDQEAHRKREFELRTGTKQMTARERARELRKNEVVVGLIDVKRRFD
jgi:transcription factor TFIIIB component B''